LAIGAEVANLAVVTPWLANATAEGKIAVMLAVDR
jgi:hypothetical protein